MHPWEGVDGYVNYWGETAETGAAPHRSGTADVINFLANGGLMFFHGRRLVTELGLPP